MLKPITRIAVRLSGILAIQSLFLLAASAQEPKGGEKKADDPVNNLTPTPGISHPIDLMPSGPAFSRLSGKPLDNARLLFSSPAVESGNAAIDKISWSTRRTVNIEAFSSASHLSLRAKYCGGPYHTKFITILICRDPALLHIGLGPEANLTESDCDQLARILLTKFAETNFDGGLSEGLTFIESTLKKNEISAVTTPRVTQSGGLITQPNPPMWWRKYGWPASSWEDILAREQVALTSEKGKPDEELNGFRLGWLFGGIAIVLFLGCIVLVFLLTKKARELKRLSAELASAKDFLAKATAGG